MSRKDAIRDRLAKHVLEELGCAMVTPTAEHWTQVNRRYRFGWMPPMKLDDEALMVVVSVCPELIDRITDGLDDDALGTYLSVVEAFIGDWVDRLGEDPEVVRQAVEARLYDECPGLLEMVSAVEARAVDLDIVPVMP